MEKEFTEKKNAKSPVAVLRRKKLSSGLPFIIHTKELSSRQGYYEFPDGTIELVTISSGNEITTLRKLSPKEADTLREKLHLESVI